METTVKSVFGGPRYKYFVSVATSLEKIQMNEAENGQYIDVPRSTLQAWKRVKDGIEQSFLKFFWSPK